MSHAGIAYQVRFPEPERHVYEVTIRVDQPAPTQCFQMASWIPGSYLIREFAKQVHGVGAWQGQRKLAIDMVGKDLWQVQADPQQPLEIRYRVMAHDDSVRTAWLDTRRGFFNGTSLFMRVVGQHDQAVTVDIQAPESLAQWQLATALRALKVKSSGFGLYTASSFDELVDHPVEMGRFWSGEFKLRGVVHRLVVSGASARMDGQRLLHDTQKACEAVMSFWHGARGRPPFDRYVFLLNTLPTGYGGLEHRNSTALLAQHSDLPRRDSANDHEGYLNLLGLISHEYFHTWNVKRLKPAQFEPYDYQQENLTQLLWFFEGFTSYYDDLLLRRAGLLSTAQYLARLQKTLTQVTQTPGRKQHSLAQSSFEAWTKYYRADSQSPNLTVSYYTKGSLVALCWDLTLRLEGHCLDDVMRLLWRQTQGGPMTEADWLQALQTVRGRSGAREHKAWVHGTHDLPVLDLLAQHGVGTKAHPLPWNQRLGLRLQSGAGLSIAQVLDDTWAARAGFAPGDEWVAVGEGQELHQAWRLLTLDDLDTYAAVDKPLKAWVFRRRQGLMLNLPSLRELAKPSGERLDIQDAAKIKRWLG